MTTHEWNRSDNPPTLRAHFSRSDVVLSLHHPLCAAIILLCIDEKGRDLNYRKPRFLNSKKLLGHVFAINITAYAVMSNHHHLILHIDNARSDSWSMEEVIAAGSSYIVGPTDITDTGSNSRCDGAFAYAVVGQN